MHKNKTKAELIAELEQARIKIAMLESASAKGLSEEKQRIGDEYLRTLVESLDISLCRWLPDTTLTYVNEKYRQIFGARGGMTGQKWLNYLPEEMRASTAAFHKELMKKPRAVTYERPVTVEDGSLRQYHWIDTPIFDEHGKVLEFQSIGMDVTERKRAEEALRESEERFRTFIEQSTDGFLLTDEQGIIIEWNQAITQITGLPREQALGRTMWDLQFQLLTAQKHAVRDITQMENTMVGMLRSGQSLYLERIVETDIQSITGETKFIQQISFPIRTSQGYRIGAVVRDITESKRSHDLLHQSEAKYRALVEQIPAVIYLDAVDEVSSAIYISPQVEALIGYSPEEWLADRALWPKLIHPEDRERVLAEHTRTNASREPFKMEYRMLTRAGDSKWVRDEAVLLHNDAGEPLYWQGFIFDITERKRVEEALRTSEEKFSKAFLASPDSVVISDLNTGLYLDVNESFLRLTGYERSEIIGFSSLERNVWANAEDRSRLVNALLTQGFARNLEAKYRCKSGELRDALVSAEIIELEGGKKHLLAVVRDITEYKLAEDKVRESEERFRTVADFTYDWEYWQDENKQLLYISPSCKRITGHDRDEFMQDPSLLRKVIHPADQEKYDEHMALHFTDPEACSLDFRVITTQGEEHWINHTCQDVYGKDGQWRGRRVSNRDITIRKQFENKLRESESKYRLLVETSIEGIWSMDREHFTTYINQAMADMLGYKPAEILGKKVDDFFFTDDMEFHQERMRIRHAGGDEIYERRFRRQDGSPLWTLVSAHSLKDPQGNFAGSFAMFTDITERKRTEQALQESERKLSTLLSNLIGFAYRCQNDRDWSMEYISEGCLEITGYQPDDLIGNRTLAYNDLIHLTDRERVWETIQSALKMQTSYHIEYRIISRNGNEKWVWEQGRGVFNGKTLTALEGFITDITDKKLAEQALLASEEKYRGLMESLDSAVSIVTRAGTIQYMNATAIMHQDMSAQEIQGKSIFDIFPETLASTQLENIQRTFDQDAPYTVEEVLILQTKPRWHRTSMQPIHDEYGNVVSVLVSSSDIHELKTAQQELQELNRTLEERVRERTLEIEATRQRLELATQTARLGVWDWNVKTGELLWDEQVYAIYGLAQDTFRASTESFLSIIYPEDAPDLQQFIQKALASQTPGQVEYRVVRGDGTLGYVKAHGAIRSDSEGHPEHIVGVVQDVTAEKLAEKTLRESEETFRAVFNTSPDAIGVFDAQSNILMINPVAVQIFNYLSAAEMNGKNVLDFYLPEDIPQMLDIIQQIFAKGSVHDIQFPLLRKDGSTFSAEFSSAALYDAEHNPRGIIVVTRDISERKRAEDTLLLTNAELERALRVKDEFLANMSHELRTPLNAIIGISESLAEQIAGELNSKQLKYVNTISESGQHLLALINDILDLSKIEAGKISLDKTKININSVCRSSLNIVKELAQKKELDVRCEIDANTDLLVADERRLKQMLVNLLSNAVKFTPANGKVGLEVRGDRQNNTIRFTVWDSGIGIRPEDQPRLFKPFVQVDASLSRGAGGTGLGLALVAQMARLHGGSVSLESRYGEGSRFTITLPWENITTVEAIPSKTSSEKSHTQPEDINKKKQIILLVEDTDTAIMVIQDYLDFIGYTVVVARNGQEGVSAAEAVRPDLILMDVQMPGMNGLEATQILREKPAFKNTPIIALTALAMTSDREKCLAAGMNDYLSKPVNLKEMVQVIEDHLNPAKTRNS